jgi:hypothetical protein
MLVFIQSDRSLSWAAYTAEGTAEESTAHEHSVTWSKLLTAVVLSHEKSGT